MSCSLTRLLHVGCVGPDVLACSRALRRVLGARSSELTQTNRFESRMHADVVWFQRRERLGVDGIIGPVTFGRLRASVDSIGCGLLDRMHAPPAANPRDLVVNAALFGVRHEASWRYCECRPIDGWADRWQVTVATDCSGYAKLAYWWAIRRDLDGGGASGFTGTLIEHGARVAAGGVRRGDLVFYSNPDHVAIVAPNTSMVYTFGGEPGPLIRPLYYRTPTAFRSYLP